MTSLLVASSLRPLAVDLYGYGRVGRALHGLLPKDGIACANIRTRERWATGPRDPDARPVLVDATPPLYSGPGAKAWVETLKRALVSGIPVVTCNKAPLATDWHGLRSAAEAGGVPLYCSATVGAGTPVLATLRRLQTAHGLERIEATLSGTLSYVLARAREGLRLEDAVGLAQAAGLAEPDPTLDLDGTDALAKAHIIHNAVFGDAAPLSVRDGQGRIRLEDDAIQRIVADGRTPQVIATIQPGRAELQLVGVEPAAWPQARPAEIVVQATTRSGEAYALHGPGAGPSSTASALFGDLRLVQEANDRRGGILP